MKRALRFVVASIAAWSALSSPAIAQPAKTDDHAKHHAAAGPGVAGEIRKVDREAGKLTIKHDEIKHLDMPPMTMVFQVKDAALLDWVKVGDKVQFTVEKASSGAYVVTDVKPSK